MLHLAFLASALLLTPPASATLPCARPLSGIHVPAFTAAVSGELGVQTECLAWEASVQPKAELIPPTVAPAPPRLAAVRKVVVAPYRATTLDALLNAPRSFHLGAVLSPDRSPIAAPRPSERRP